MKYLSSLLILVLAIFTVSCTSLSENVKQNKEKFIQVGIENSQPVDVSNLESVYQSAQSNNTEAKLKYLNVDKLQTQYQDSFVLFIKDNEMVVYDFAPAVRAIPVIEQKVGLIGVEQIDERLFVGKKKD